MTSDFQPDNPFASPRIVDEEPIQAEVIQERRRKKKKELAPASVVFAMLTALSLTPLVPLGLLFLGPAAIIVAVFNFVFSFLLLMKSPNTWWVSNLYYGPMFISFVGGYLFQFNALPPQYQMWGQIGMITNAVLLVLFSLPDSRKYYFGRPA